MLEGENTCFLRLLWAVPLIETGRYMPSAMLPYLLHGSYRINLNGRGEMVQT